ncbi:GNAT family N-acetyltransferase [Candidatus Aerophobetes bacterium]|nr:GNAT family N-acetyltransferase [Candidatus Aerophobetes bacterium]
MSLRLEEYDPEKHDERTVASLIYLADCEFGSLVYGSKEEGVELIVKLMRMKYNYFTPPYLHCAIYQNKVVGVLAGFYGKEKRALGRTSGKDFLKVHGLWRFLKKMPIFMRMNRLICRKIGEDDYYVQTLCVHPSCRGRGFGTQILELALEEHGKLCLDTNIKNAGAIRFYERLGFKVYSENIVRLKKKRIGTYSMRTE